MPQIMPKLGELVRAIQRHQLMAICSIEGGEAAVLYMPLAENYLRELKLVSRIL